MIIAYVKRLCSIQSRPTKVEFFADTTTDSVLVRGPDTLPNLTLYRNKEKYVAINDLSGETLASSHPEITYRKAIERWWLKPLSQQKYKVGDKVRVKLEGGCSTGTVKNFYPATGCHFLSTTDRDASYDVEINRHIRIVTLKHILGRA